MKDVANTSIMYCLTSLAQQIKGELKANNEADEAEGKDGVCTFKTKNLLALLKKWKSESFSTDDWKTGNCRGTMFDQTIWKIKQ